MSCMQVRGAYVKLERARAAELGYPSPIWDNIDGTHANFDRCLDAVLEEVCGCSCWQHIAPKAKLPFAKGLGPSFGCGPCHG